MYEHGACPADKLDQETKKKYCETNSGDEESVFLTFEECMSDFLLDKRENIILTFNQIK